MRELAIRSPRTGIDWERPSIISDNEIEISQRAEKFDRALQMMRDALAILDDQSQYLAAAHLCQAIEALEPSGLAFNGLNEGG